LKTYDVAAVWLTPKTPAARLLDRMQGWRRIYSDYYAIVQVRIADCVQCWWPRLRSVHELLAHSLHRPPVALIIAKAPAVSVPE
jgi:hypothetical protein